MKHRKGESLLFVQDFSAYFLFFLTIILLLVLSTNTTAFVKRGDLPDQSMYDSSPGGKICFMANGHGTYYVTASCPDPIRQATNIVRELESDEFVEVCVPLYSGFVDETKVVSCKIKIEDTTSSQPFETDIPIKIIHSKDCNIEGRKQCNDNVVRICKEGNYVEYDNCKTKNMECDYATFSCIAKETDSSSSNSVPIGFIMLILGFIILLLLIFSVVCILFLRSSRKKSLQQVQIKEECEFCSNCGKKMNKGDKFCMSCGKKL